MLIIKFDSIQLFLNCNKISLIQLAFKSNYIIRYICLDIKIFTVFSVEMAFQELQSLIINFIHVTKYQLYKKLPNFLE